MDGSVRLSTSGGGRRGSLGRGPSERERRLALAGERSFGAGRLLVADPRRVASASRLLGDCLVTRSDRLGHDRPRGFGTVARAGRTATVERSRRRRPAPSARLSCRRGGSSAHDRALEPGFAGDGGFVLRARGGRRRRARGRPPRFPPAAREWEHRGRSGRRGGSSATDRCRGRGDRSIRSSPADATVTVWE